MSDTPRTDCQWYRPSESDLEVVDRDFAEQLERELQEAKQLLHTVLKENGINTLGRIKIEMFLESEAGDD
jgi:hypothetical protein